MIAPTPYKTTQPKNIRAVLVVYGLLVSISAFVAALTMFLIPSEPGNIQFLGLSYQRWLLIGSAFLPGALAAVFTFKVYLDQIWAKSTWSGIVGNEKLLQRIVQFTAVSFLGGWLASFTPAYVFADYKDYYFRLSPLFYWFTFVSAITLAIALKEKYGFHWPSLLNSLRAQKQALTVSCISLCVFILIWILIASTGLGIRVVEDYWYGAGVPILGIQVLIAFAIGLGVFYYEKSSFGARFSIRSNFLIFVIIWIAAAFFWIQEPLHPGFFAPGPYPPNFEYYPYSDASLFDLGSQYALIGQGINNGVPFDRVLYMFFLVFLHVIGGQNYLKIIALQTAIYGVFPGILFLLGKDIHSRTFGIILAVLAILRGVNGIAASNMIDLANQTQMLTDFPMVIFVSLFSLMLVKWLRAPGKNYLYIISAGGVAGLGIMLRTHAFFLLIFGILLILAIFRHQRSRGVLAASLLMMGALASILPWGVQGGNFLEIYKQRIQARYGTFLAPIISTPEPQGNTSPVLSSIGWGTAIAPATPSELFSLAESHYQSFSETPSSVLYAKQSTDDGVETLSLYTSVITNFLHNLITSVFILPTSPIFHDLRHTLKEVTPFWHQYWDGRLGIGAGLFLIFNLSLISTGIGFSWKSAGNAGLVPLGIFLFYNFANAVARTSGGRYIVPADWIVFFYFALGLLMIIRWGTSILGHEDVLDVKASSYVHASHPVWTWQPLKRAPWILMIFLLVGALLPLSEHVFARKYPTQSKSQLLNKLDEEGYLTDMGFDKAALKSVSQQWPAFTILYGRALYPRFFLENKGLPKNQYPYMTLGYPRLGFILIGSEGANIVVLPEDHVSYFPNASDVIVLGCNESNHIDALAILVIEEKNILYVRQPVSSLQCPLQQPVCDDNHVCH